MLADNSWCPKLINTTEKHYFGINSEHRKNIGSSQARI